jgi:hypothetical protein
VDAIVLPQAAMPKTTGDGRSDQAAAAAIQVSPESSWGEREGSEGAGLGRLTDPEPKPIRFNQARWAGWANWANWAKAHL